MSASSTINNKFLKMLIVCVLFSQSLNTIDNHFLLKRRGLVCCMCVCTYKCMCEYNLRSLRSTVVELKELSDKPLAFSLTLTPTSWGWSLWLVCLAVTRFPSYILHPWHEEGSYCVAQAGLELVTHQPLPPRAGITDRHHHTQALQGLGEDFCKPDPAIEVGTDRLQKSWLTYWGGSAGST